MADLSYLPPVADTIEADPLDLDNYQPPSERMTALPVGNYLLRLIDGAVEKKDADGNVEGVFPILYDLTAEGYLKATFSVQIEGLITRNADKTETATDSYKGRTLKFQRINRAPFKKGNRIGSDMMTDMLHAFGYDVSTLKGGTRAERNQLYADALEQCLGKLAKGRVVRRRAVDTGEVKDGRKVYKEFKNADFDEAGLVEFEGKTYEAYNEVDGFFRWAGSESPF